MGRTRTTREGNVIPRELGRRQQAKVLHRAHVPRSDTEKFEACARPAVPQTHHDLDDRRQMILREAINMGVYAHLLDYQQAALNRPITDVRTATEIEAYEVNLGTIELGIQRLYARKRCETSRKALLKLITSSGHLASPILANLRYGVIEPTPRLSRAEAYRLRYIHFEALLARFP